MTTVMRIIKIDQGWTVPNIIGVDINRKMRQDSISSVISIPLFRWSVESVVGCQLDRLIGCQLSHFLFSLVFS